MPGIVPERWRLSSRKGGRSENDLGQMSRREGDSWYERGQPSLDISMRRHIIESTGKEVLRAKPLYLKAMSMLWANVIDENFGSREGLFLRFSR